MNSAPSPDRPCSRLTVQALIRAVEQTADHVIITDRDGAIQYVNPAFEKLTGFRLEEIAGQTPRIVNSGRHPVGFFQKLWQTIHSGGVFRSVFMNKKKSGEIYFEEKTISPIKDELGVITHFISIGRDITDQREVEEEHDILIGDLQAALAQVRRLQGPLPICAWCKRIRDDHGHWNQLESYLRVHSEAELTHSICPTCAKELIEDPAI